MGARRSSPTPRAGAPDRHRGRARLQVGAARAAVVLEVQGRRALRAVGHRPGRPAHDAGAHRAQARLLPARPRPRAPRADRPAPALLRRLQPARGHARGHAGQSVGWADVYPSTYPDNWIDVTGLSGCFAVVHRADPGDGIFESNEDNNASSKIVRLPYRPGPQRCPRGAACLPRRRACRPRRRLRPPPSDGARARPARSPSSPARRAGSAGRSSLRLADEGCAVGLCARDADEVQRAAGELRALGVGAHGVAADVTDEAALTAAVDECARELGGLDLVVANAGGAAGGAGARGDHRGRLGADAGRSTSSIRPCSCARPCRTCAPAAAARRC